ncbi:SpoIIE family protein phosphatase [Isoptericola jiangsuensis]|uniref:SpoIIE family protein phosphatase n=1 Tax=Isoptericola jiangsuensis TaxID=548579 RepID=UPI003AAC5AF1
MTNLTTPRTVLVVDDTDAHRYVMATWLRNAGYDVVEASTGGAALTLATAATDAVVLDVNLPDVPGREVCRRLKEAATTSQVPVLHVSATSIDAASRTAGLQGGADAYLPEPLDRAEFLATIDSLCRNHAEKRGMGRAARRLEALGEALVPLHEARSPERAADLVARGAAAVLGRPVIAMVVAEPQTVLRSLCVAPDAPLVRGRGTAPVLPPGPLSETVFRADEVPPAWRPLIDRAALPPAAWWTVWLRDSAGDLVGGLAVQVAPGQETPAAEDQRVVRRFVEATSVALANLRSFAEEHRIITALQHAMLPAQLPDLPGLDVAACYEASDDRLDVGGDFYDAFGLPDGRMAVVIGDVQGHSLRAATVMAQVRLTLRAYLREGHDAGRALNLLSDSLRQDHAELVTVCVCVVDPATGALEATDAGHLPAVVVRQDGTTTSLKAPSRLLGLPAPDVRPVDRTVLAPGDLLVLVTDGLVERRGSTLRAGIERLLEAAAGLAGLAADETCRNLLDRFDDGEREDDVAIVAVRRTDPGA